MSEQRRAIDFRALAEEVQDAGQQWGQAQLAIWGGQCDEANVLTLLEDWPQRDETMPHRIWEYADQIVFEENTLPHKSDWLEHGRLFGPGGDLSVRRGGEHFYWHFVGRPGTQPPDGDFQARYFWSQPGEANAIFYRRKECALLWGERQEGFDLWFEARTGRAKLCYPLDQTGRVRVIYQTFSRAGRVEFVWLLRLEAYDG